MAEPELPAVLEQHRPAQISTSDELERVESASQVPSRSTANLSSGQKALHASEPAPIAWVKENTPLESVSAIAQASEKTISQGNILPAIAPRTASFGRELPAGFSMPQPVRLTFHGLAQGVEYPLGNPEVR